MHIIRSPYDVDWQIHNTFYTFCLDSMSKYDCGMDDEYSFYHVNYQPCPQFLTNVLGYTIMVVLPLGAFKIEELYF